MDLVEAKLQSLAELPREGIRAAIMELQEYLLANTADTTDLAYFPVQHKFAPGSYAREMTIPEKQIILGKIHRHAHINVISKGSVVVLSEFGLQRMQAPCTFVSEPGIKRVVYAVETTVWTTVHVTNETDLEKIEAEVIAEAYSDIEVQADFRRIT